MGKKGTELPLEFVLTALPAIAFLAFILGTFFYEFKLWPYRTIHDAYEAARAWKQRLQPPDRYDNDGFFGPAYREESGIIINSPEKAYNGLTLFTSSNEPVVKLMDMEGEMVHEWEVPFSKVWPSNPPHIIFPTPDEEVVISKGVPYPNGELLVIYQSMNDTPYGYGLAKVDKDANVLWKYADNVHHDVNLGPDGKIYTLTLGLEKGKRVDWYNDWVVVLSPEGEELQKVSIYDAFQNSDYANAIGPLTFWDPLHTNSVEVLDEAIADKYPFLKAGQVLVSLRTPNVIAVIDLEEEKVVWASTGGWSRQHDPDFLANGNILLFDNRGDISPGGPSRVMEIDPQTRAIEWQYNGSAEEPFDSSVASSQERLPNGNTLITNSCYGRIFEVTPAGEIVWEYNSPFRAPGYDNITETVYQAQRYLPDYFTFLSTASLP